MPVAKDVYTRPTSISFLRICQSPATDVVVVAYLRGVFFVSSLIAACSLGPCSLRKQFFYASRGFVQMAGNSVVDVPRCDTSWYELYVWMLSWRRRSRRQDVSSCWKWGRREWRWRLAGRGNWWRGRLVKKKMTTLLAAVNENLDVQTHNERSSSSRDRRYECTSIVASDCESAVRRTSKREGCVKLK